MDVKRVMSDKNAKFVLRIHDDFGRGTAALSMCHNCQQEAQLCLKYDEDPILPENIKLDNRVIYKPNKPLGVTCGCYAKFHRQVAHIETRIKDNKKKKEGKKKK